LPFLAAFDGYDCESQMVGKSSANYDIDDGIAANSLEDCIASCDAEETCALAEYKTGSNTCHRKNGIGQISDVASSTLYIKECGKTTVTKVL